jgi:hypothetical protein
MNVPPTSPSDLAADAEEFHSSFRLFISAVEMLAAPPDEQCRLMGDYNVAWELKEDVGAGRYLVNRGYLSATQEAWVTALVGALEAAPTLQLSSGAGREANLSAMSAPCWEPLRFLATQVLVQLSGFSEENARYLHLPNHAA